MTASAFPTYEPKPRDFAARIGRRASGIGGAPRRRHAGRRALALLSAVAVPAFAAPEDWSSFAIGNAGHAPVQVQPMPFEQPGESFPGSAFYFLAPDDAGLGAASLPLDPLAHSDAEPLVPQPGPAARALRIDNSGVDRSRAIQCLTAAIYYEAASEPDAGQRAVAQVVLNRVAHPAYPNTVCGVVYQGSERVTGCQFSFTCDGSLVRVPNRFFWLRAEEVARAALSGFVYAPVGLATHYHTIAVHPYWAPSLSFVGTIGAHRFYKFGGTAGRPATFRFAYVGGEPIAAPHARSDATAATFESAPDPLAIQRAYDDGLKIAQSGTLSGAVTPTHAGFAPVRNVPAPSYAADVRARGGDAQFRGQNLPEATGIKPEFESAGKWIVQPGN